MFAHVVKSVASLHEHVEEVERLADELNKLLAHHVSVLRQSGLHDHARRLARWADCYRHGLRYGLLAYDYHPENENAWLAGMSDRLKLENEELKSLEDRSPPIAEEGLIRQRETEHFMVAVRCISLTVYNARGLSLYSSPLMAAAA